MRRLTAEDWPNYALMPMWALCERAAWLCFSRTPSEWIKLSERGLKSSRHSRYDYLIKYAYFVKCFLNRIASISDPKKWTSNVAQWKKHVNAISNNSWHQTVEAIPSCSILSLWDGKQFINIYWFPSLASAILLPLFLLSNKKYEKLSLNIRVTGV